jgi:hypothetical protein
VPAVRWRREALPPLSGRPLDDPSVMVPRRVSREGLVAYEGHHDAGPSPDGGRPVLRRVREAPAVREIWAEATGLAVPPRRSGQGHQSRHPDQLTGLWSLTPQGTGPRARTTPSPRDAAPAPLHRSPWPPMPDGEVRPLRG